MPDAIQSIPESAEAPGARRLSLLTGSLVEALGAFLVVLAGLGIGMFNPQAGLAPGLAFGLALVVAITAFGHRSGGYFNPALTLGLAMSGRIGWKTVLPYVLAQLIGALAASGLFWLILSAHPGQIQINGLFSSVANGFADHSQNQFPLASVLLVEVVAGALLTAVLLGATAKWASRAAAPFAIGLAYAVLVVMLAPIDGGAINPARSTAAALFADGWALEQLWLFWVAPLLGAVIAGLLYRSIELGSRVRNDDGDPSGREPLADLTASTGAVPAAAVSEDGARPGAAAVPAAAVPEDEARAFFDGQAKP